MRFEALEVPTGADRPLQKLDARIKLIFVLVFVVVAVAVPVAQWRVLGALGLALALMIGISGASLRTLALSWAGFAVMIGFLAVLVAPGCRPGPSMGSRRLSCSSSPRTAWPSS